MGWKLKRVDLKGKDQIKPNQEKDLCLVLEREDRAAIHGVVKFPNGRPVKNAIVKLFKRDRKCTLTPITFAFTDDCGQFLFGVEADVDYVIKVFFYRPETCDDPCDDDPHDPY